MVNDSDLPAIENEEWQYALVHYAAWKALTKEGKMTQDLQKAQIHAQLYQDVINDILSITRPDIDVSARVAMPFFV
jgi:hypothetical protein